MGGPSSSMNTFNADDEAAGCLIWVQISIADSHVGHENKKHACAKAARTLDARGPVGTAGGLLCGSREVDCATDRKPELKAGGPADGAIPGEPDSERSIEAVSTSKKKRRRAGHVHSPEDPARTKALCPRPPCPLLSLGSSKDATKSL